MDGRSGDRRRGARWAGPVVVVLQHAAGGEDEGEFAVVLHFQRNEAPGSTTFANFAVSLMKISCTTRKSSALSAFFTCSVFRLGEKITRLVRGAFAGEWHARTAGDSSHTGSLLFFATGFVVNLAVALRIAATTVEVAESPASFFHRRTAFRALLFECFFVVSIRFASLPSLTRRAGSRV